MEYIKLEAIHDHISLLTLNRPDRYNALSFQVLREFHQALDQLEQDIKTRVVVLTGAGKGFCAGADLKAAASGENGAWEEGLGKVQGDYRMQQSYGGLIYRLRTIPQPIVGAVNGPAAGGGLSVALACDMRIASPNAKFNCAYTKIGLGGAEMGSSYFLPQLVGTAKASELMYTGRIIKAEEALRIGLVNDVVDDSELLKSAITLAEEMVTNASPFGLRITKEAINLVQGGMSLEQALHMENRNQVLGLQTKDFVAAAMGWSQGKAPDYQDS